MSDSAVGMQDEVSHPFLRGWLFVSFFLFSLGSHYFYSIGVYVFQIVGLFALIPLYRLNLFSWGGTRIQLLSLFFMYAFVSGVVLAAANGSALFTAPKLSLVAFYGIWVAFGAVIFLRFPYTFHSVLKAVLWTHVLVFVFQFSWYMTTGDFIDFLLPITGEEQRALGGAYEIGFLPGFLRATGLFNEPGTYSTWIIMLALLIRDNARRLGLPQRISALEVLGVVTVLLSFSTFGFVFAMIYLGVILSSHRPSPAMLGITGVVFLPIFLVGLEFLDQRMSLGTEDSGMGFRLQAIALYFSGLDIPTLFFGKGMFTDYFARADSELVFQDVGLWFVILASFGYIGVVLICAFLYLSVPRSLAACALALVVLLSKFTLTNPLIWLIFVYFALHRQYSAASVAALNEGRDTNGIGARAADIGEI